MATAASERARKEEFISLARKLARTLRLENPLASNVDLSDEEDLEYQNQMVSSWAMLSFTR